MTLRIAVAAHRLAVSNPTGVDRYVTELVGALAGTADVKMVVGAAAEADTPSWVPPGVDVRHMRGPRTLITMSWCLTGRPRVDRAFLQPDLVHVAVPAYPIPARAPAVHCFHDLFPLRHPEWFSRKERFGFRRALAAAIEAPAIIASSETTAGDLVAAGADPHRVVVVPLGISEAFFAAGRDMATKGDHDYDLFVGAVNARKRVDVVVRGARRRPPPSTSGHRRAPGRGRRRARHPRTSPRDRGARPPRRVRRRPHALPGLMAGARALVHPSREEGFGFTPLEAMAAGTPAVVAAGGALAEAVGDAGIAVHTPDEPEVWAEALDRLDDTAARRAAGEQGHARASRFTWHETATRTVSVWRNVLDGNPPGTERGGTN